MLMLCFLLLLWSYSKILCSAVNYWQFLFHLPRLAVATFSLCLFLWTFQQDNSESCGPVLMKFWTIILTSTRWLDFCNDDDADRDFFSGSGIGTIQWTLLIAQYVDDNSLWKFFEGSHFRIRIREFFKPNFTSAEWTGSRNCVQWQLLVRALQCPNASTLFCLFLLWESAVTQW